jgi:hypothetical protein
LAIFVLVLWLATGSAGLALLRAGGASRRAALTAAQPEPAAVGVQRLGAVPLTPDGMPPRVPHTRVQAPAGQHPVLEFSHPALAVTGMACWTMFTFVHYRPLAWIAFAVLAVTLLIGLGWFASNRRAGQRQTPGAMTFPRRLLLAHGLIAGATLALTVLSAVVAASR